jgi:hypothetical protein
MKTKLLTEATLLDPMLNITGHDNDVLDIWPYVRSIPSADLQQHELYDQFVEYVYRTADGHYDHVLVMTTPPWLLETPIEKK